MEENGRPAPRWELPAQAKLSRSPRSPIPGAGEAPQAGSVPRPIWSRATVAVDASAITPACYWLFCLAAIMMRIVSQLSRATEEGFPQKFHPHYRRMGPLPHLGSVSCSLLPAFLAAPESLPGFPWPWLALPSRLTPSPATARLAGSLPFSLLLVRTGYFLTIIGHLVLLFWTQKIPPKSYPVGYRFF